MLGKQGVTPYVASQYCPSQKGI